MSSSFAMFDWLLLAVSVYVLYAGVTGKGRLYSVENIKEDKQEEFKMFSRKIYIFLGIAMVINSAASLLRSTFYAYEEVTAATDTTAAVFDWVTKKDLGVFSFLTPMAFDIISYVALALTLGLIVLLVVKMRKYIDKDAQAKKSQGASCARGGCNTMPSSAFDFDDEDKKQQ
ncbi:MAG: hypothetical protein GX417_03805 [Clostridiales bacterium]|nr:hypothetical protein [Clostridiales bacterium]